MKTLHTIDVIYEIMRRNKSVKEFNFAVYFYVPETLTEKGRLKIYPIKVNQITNFQDFQKKLDSIKIPNNWILGLISQVKMLNGEYRHIPQIDFQCPISKKNLNLIKKQFLQIIKIFPGYILESGKSYHYIGLQLLNEKEWKKFIGRCLLCNFCKRNGTERMVDERWFGHSLLRGSTDLRIFATDSRPEPKVVAFLKKKAK